MFTTTGQHPGQGSQAEGMVQTSKQWCQAVFESSPIGVAVCEADGRVTQANWAFLDVTGWSLEECQRLTRLDLIPAECAEIEAEQMIRLERTGRCGPYETEYVQPSGRRVPVQVNGVRVPGAGAACTWWFVENILERRCETERLRQAKETAEATSEAKSRFLADTSHEIRTSLTAILGFAECLLEPDLSESERTSAANTILRSGQHLLGITNQVLDLSKIEAGKLSVERRSCSVAEVVAEVVSLLRVCASVKGLDLRAEWTGTIPQSIRTDPTRLRQILLNLAGNAVKFTDRGCVRIVTSMPTPPGAEQPCLQIEVIDSGVGMTPEQLAKLFRPFTQAGRSTEGRFGGTGLGLVISQRLAELLGGGIVARSEPGAGSRFTVTIPIGPLDGVELLEASGEALVRPRQPDSGAKATLLPDGLDCRVLLAEDSPDNQRLISGILSRMGAEVEPAIHGREAVEKALAPVAAEDRPFDVILMDMHMPVLDGYAATRELRQRGYAGPIIALTANAMPGDREKCLAAGCDDFATKPIDRQALIGMVANHARRSS